MSGRSVDTTVVDNALRQRFETLSQYRQRTMDAGNTRLQQVADLGNQGATFMPEVPESNREELLTLAQQRAQQSRGQSFASMLRAQRQATQLTLQALENPQETMRAVSSFYNPITGERTSLTEADPDRFFRGSIQDMQNNLQGALRSQIQAQVEPFMMQYDEEEQSLRAELQMLQSQQGEATSGSQLQRYSEITQRLGALRQERLSTMQGVLQDTFGADFEFTRLNEGDTRLFERITGSSVEDYLARTQEELIEIYGEERGAEEQQRRELLRQQFDINRQLANESRTSTERLNASTEARNRSNLEEADRIRRESQKKEETIRRERRGNSSSMFSTGLSLDFGDRPL